LRFRDRTDAGRQLAFRLLAYRQDRPLVMAITNGGVPLAYEIARSLEAPLDLWLVKKVRSPDGQRTWGAVAQGGHLSFRRGAVREAGTTDVLEEQVRQAAGAVGEGDARLRGMRPPSDVKGRTVILVDDGVETGETARAAIEALRASGVHTLVLAVAVAPSEVLTALEQEADATVCLHPWAEPQAVGAGYEDFREVRDEDVAELLSRAAQRSAAPEERATEVQIPLPGGTTLEGSLSLPADPLGVVLFAHGSGSSRFSPRGRGMAGLLHRHGIGTLHFDLLTPEEQRPDGAGAPRFDVGLLARRLKAVTDWTAAARPTAYLPIGYLGASTGAAAALIASVDEPRVRAVVSRGGRPDLAMDVLQQVEAPTLLLVGTEDPTHLALNQRAYARLWAPRQLVEIPGATHHFEEPGALDQVAELAADWFVRFLPIGLTAEQTDSWE
jgi:putative phosphoribosyl transferase